jgi:hypothetical protein
MAIYMHDLENDFLNLAGFPFICNTVPLMRLLAIYVNMKFSLRVFYFTHMEWSQDNMKYVDNERNPII